MNAKEYNDCVRQYADDLYRFALRYCGSEPEAEDAVQDTFVTLWERHDDIRTEGVKGYLIRMLYRRLVDLHRHRCAMPQLPDSEDEGWRQHDSFELRYALQQALNQLPEDQRMLVLLRDLEGYSYADMAKLTGIGEQQAGVYLWRARKTLRKLLEDYR